jgi:D-alanyl-D-alanine carboxypeptidase/D-alanyl-D-alanine-endopeptidase (penicillin-binding protein 4)
MLIGSVQRRWISVAAFVAAVVLLGAGALAQGSLERRIAAAVEKARLGKASVGVSVVDADSDRELASFSTGESADQSLIPASNLKLITTGAALLTLGPDFEFRTSFVLLGNQLVVEGCGDPALADPDLLSKMQTGVEQFLDRLADSIAAAARGRVAAVVIDDRVFDRDLVHPLWPTDQLNRAYCAPVCGVNFHRNVLSVFPAPAARAGDPPSVRTEPAATWIEFDNQRARTIREGDTAVWIERGGSPWQFRLHGSVRTAPTDAVRVAVREPAPIFGRLLADRLAARQRGPVPEVRMVDPEAPVASGQPGATVAAIVRTPISVVLERCNVDSDNLYAEALLKLTGHHVTRQPGSWSNGSAVVRMIIKDRLGAQHAASTFVSDGSGLARANRVSARTLAAWIANVASDGRVGETYVRSMAVAKEEGTLRRRFRNKTLTNEVRAKSGYINGVRTLSGVVLESSNGGALVGAGNGRRLAFAILVNDIPAGADERAKELHENIVEILDNYINENRRTAAAGGR